MEKIVVRAKNIKIDLGNDQYFFIERLGVIEYRQMLKDTPKLDTENLDTEQLTDTIDSGITLLTRVIKNWEGIQDADNKDVPFSKEELVGLLSKLSPVQLTFITEAVMKELMPNSQDEKEVKEVEEDLKN